MNEPFMVNHSRSDFMVAIVIRSIQGVRSDDGGKAACPLSGGWIK